MTYITLKNDLEVVDIAEKMVEELDVYSISFFITHLFDTMNDGVRKKDLDILKDEIDMYFSLD